MTSRFHRLEVGYLFNRAFWRHGYATEAAAAIRDRAFTDLAASEIWAQVRDTNLASMNVAIRLGRWSAASSPNTTGALTCHTLASPSPATNGDGYSPASRRRGPVSL